MTHAPKSSRAAASLLGCRVGTYVLDVLLGEGGTGAVYEATGPAGRRVAIKVLHEEVAADAATRVRFSREAYVANRIDHPGIVRVIEDGATDEGLPFLAMDLLVGETIDARWERKGWRLPVSEVLWIADRTLDVLAAAHALGVVHRDVKPENLFVTVDRRLKVLDFGIARLGDGAAGNVTRIGTVLGTLGFMPPEQARGETGDVGVASDLWAVGATMFALLSGRLVHEGRSLASLLVASRDGVIPSLGEVVPELPSELVTVVDLALSPDTKARWPDARVMQRAVRLVYADLATRERPSLADAEAPPSSRPIDMQALVKPIRAPAWSLAAGVPEVPSLAIDADAPVIDGAKEKRRSTNRRSGETASAKPSERRTEPPRGGAASTPWIVAIAVLLTLVAIVVLSLLRR